MWKREAVAAGDSFAGAVSVRQDRAVTERDLNKHRGLRFPRRLHGVERSEFSYLY